MNRCILLLLTYLLLPSAQGQQAVIDSLENALADHTAPDTHRVDLLTKMAYLVNQNSPDTSYLLADSAYRLSLDLNYLSGQAMSLNHMGGALFYKGAYPEALDYSLRGLKLFEVLEDSAGLAQSYNSIAINYSMQGQFDDAQTYFIKSIAIYDAQSNYAQLARAYNNLGRINYMMGHYEQAIQYLNLVRDSDKSPLNLYASVTNTLGDVYQKLDQPLVAKKYYEEAYQIVDSLNIPRLLTYSTRGLAEIHQILGQLIQSNAFALLTLDRSKEIGYLENVKNSAYILYENYEHQDNPVMALHFFKQYVAAKDSMFSQTKEREMRALRENFQLAQKEKRIELLEAAGALQYQKNKNQTNIIWAGLTILSLAGLIMLILFRNNQTKERTSKKLLAQSRELEAANQMKDKLFSIISHDLRSPFNSLLSITKYLNEMDISPDQLRKISHQLHANVKSLADMLNSLLEWAKSNMSGQEMEKETLSVGQLIKENLDVFKDLALEKNITLTYEDGIEAPLYVRKAQAASALRNLINNALKFTKPGGTVHVQTADAGAFVNFKVTDNGVGMSEEIMSKILDAQTKYSTPGTSNEAGSGLGLIFCKEFIENQGGTLAVTSEEGKGTTFSFTLPKAV